MAEPLRKHPVLISGASSIPLTGIIVTLRCYKYFAFTDRRSPRFRRNLEQTMSVLKITRILFQLCRFGLAALFLFTAAAKLWIMKEFARKVAELLRSMQM